MLAMLCFMLCFCQYNKRVAMKITIEKTVEQAHDQ